MYKWLNNLLSIQFLKLDHNHPIYITPLNRITVQLRDATFVLHLSIVQTQADTIH